MGFLESGICGFGLGFVKSKKMNSRRLFETYLLHFETYLLYFETYLLHFRDLILRFGTYYMFLQDLFCSTSIDGDSGDPSTAPVDSANSWI